MKLSKTDEGFEVGIDLEELIIYVVYYNVALPQQSYSLLAIHYQLTTFIIRANMLIIPALCILLIPLTFSHPVDQASGLTKRQDSLDTTVLQFALTLEHLENVFYKHGLQKFTAQDFAEAGFGANYHNNLQLIASDEAQHVKFLTDALTAAGAAPVAECTYNFPTTDVTSFITLSTILEGVGTSAYLGGAPLITNKDILTAAGSILVTEALHTSLQRSALKAVTGPNPFGTPLDPNAIFTLAASFISACPDTNAALPFKAFPALTFNGLSCFCEGPQCNPYTIVKRQQPVTTTAPTASWSGGVSTVSLTTVTITETLPPSTAPTEACRPPTAGSTVSFVAASVIPANSFLTFISGLTVLSVVGQVDGENIHATVPEGVSGQVYAMVTSADAAGKFDAAAVLFGPAVLEGECSYRRC